MPRLVDPAVKAEAFRLRTEERLGLAAIAARTGVAKGTLSLWFRDAHRLTDAEIDARQSANALQVNAVRPKYDPAPSAAATAVGLDLSRGAHRAVSLAAVRFRLAQFGCTLLPHADPDLPTIFLVERPGGTSVVIKVKTAVRYQAGHPIVKTEWYTGRPLTADDCDALVAYDLETDRAFVFPVAACAGYQRSCKPADAEAWQRLGLPRLTASVTTPPEMLLAAAAPYRVA